MSLGVASAPATTHGEAGASRDEAGDGRTPGTHNMLRVVIHEPQELEGRGPENGRPTGPASMGRGWGEHDTTRSTVAEPDIGGLGEGQEWDGAASSLLYLVFKDDGLAIDLSEVYCSRHGGLPAFPTSTAFPARFSRSRAWARLAMSK